LGVVAVAVASLPSVDLVAAPEQTQTPPAMATAVAEAELRPVAINVKPNLRCCDEDVALAGIGRGTLICFIKR
jgi:hypothetical protein